METLQSKFDLERYTTPTTKANNNRASLIERFVRRINASRKAAGYKPLAASFYASKMSHISEDDLDGFYKKLDAAKNFSGLWWYYCVSSKKK